MLVNGNYEHVSLERSNKGGELIVKHQALE